MSLITSLFPSVTWRSKGTRRARAVRPTVWLEVRGEVRLEAFICCLSWRPEEEWRPVAKTFAAWAVVMEAVSVTDADVAAMQPMSRTVWTSMSVDLVDWKQMLAMSTALDMNNMLSVGNQESFEGDRSEHLSPGPHATDRSATERDLKFRGLANCPTKY